MGRHNRVMFDPRLPSLEPVARGRSHSVLDGLKQHAAFVFHNEVPTFISRELERIAVGNEPKSQKVLQELITSFLHKIDSQLGVDDPHRRLAGRPESGEYASVQAQWFAHCVINGRGISLVQEISQIPPSRACRVLEEIMLEKCDKSTYRNVQSCILSLTGLVSTDQTLSGTNELRAQMTNTLMRAARETQGKSVRGLIVIAQALERLNSTDACFADVAKRLEPLVSSEKPGAQKFLFNSFFEAPRLAYAVVGCTLKPSAVIEPAHLVEVLPMVNDPIDIVTIDQRIKILDNLKIYMKRLGPVLDDTTLDALKIFQRRVEREISLQKRQLP